MVNTNATNAVIKYWDGDSYETVGTVTDTTKTGTKSLGQTGLMSWNPPSGEEPRTLFGVTGYIYQLTFSAQLSGTHGDATEEILVDIVTGVPAQATVYPFDFPSIYKNRLLLCSFSEGKEGNRVDFSVTNAPNTWNGVESSMDGLQSLYFGGVEPLTTGTQLYNRYGSSIFTAWVAFKKSEIYMLTGDSPEDFKIYPISLTVGCPAPLTVATCEVGFEIAKDARRNLIVWLSFSGPYAFDGAVLYPLSGINKYFDPNESACINQDAIENARGWFDQAFREYNLLIPSGSGQTTNNLWLAYDLIRKKWYRKDPGSAEMPQTAFPVVDDDGAQYIYAGIDTGYVMRLENGNNWDGTNITQEVITGDFWPTKSIWDKTLIRYFKIMAQRIDESHTLEVKYYADSDEDNGVDVVWQDGDVAFADGDVEWAGASVATLDLSLATGTERLVRTTSILNSLGWSHAFGFEVNTSDTTKGFRPVAWGIKYQYVRDDE
ncbi:MAG: hypothetical protein GY841_13880, partial [FCB group bacterium]|nr:hypothetical protein [FCB group bacterium]